MTSLALGLFERVVQNFTNRRGMNRFTHEGPPIEPRRLKVPKIKIRLPLYPSLEHFSTKPLYLFDLSEPWTTTVTFG